MAGPKALVEHEQHVDFFNRQRRNLMVASLLLFFAKKNEMLFEGPLFGITVKEAVHVEDILVYFLAYLLLRYYQYFRDLGDKFIISTHTSKSIEVAGQIAFGIIKKKFPDRSITLQKKNIDKKSQYPLVLKIYFEEVIDGVSKQFHDIITLSKAQIPRIWIAAWLKVIFNTRLFTEFILPFFIAVGVLVYYFWDFLSIWR